MATRNGRTGGGTVARTSGGGELSQVVQLEIYGALLTLFSIVLMLALVTFDRGDVGLGIGHGVSTRNLLGPVGAHIADLFLWILGLGSFLVDVAFGYLGICAVLRRPVRLTGGRVAWSVTTLLTVAVLLQVVLRELRPLGHSAAGIIGTYAGEVMVALFSTRGTILLSAGLLAIAITYLSGHSLATLVRFGWHRTVSAVRWLGSLGRSALAAAGHGIAGLFRRAAPDAALDAPDADMALVARPSHDVHDTVVQAPRFASADDTPVERPVSVGVPWWERDDGAHTSNISAADVQPFDAPVTAARSAADAPVEVAAGSEPKIVVTPRKPAAVQGDLALPATADLAHYEAPPLALLDYVPSGNVTVDRDQLHRNAETLKRKLQDYKVEGQIVEIHPGPVVTMYEFLPAPGVKISQIANLSDDLTMALEATSIRIVAPIPGKGVVGIEVPNDVRETVYLREILSSEAFAKSRSKLTLALGKDIFGTPVVTDLAKMPHLLIAGATGSGKSVAVNAFLLSLLYNASPEDVRIILVDPKVVELQVYEGVPHLLLPVVYDPKHAATALRWAVEEMERRYEMLARLGTRNIQSYNQRVERLLGHDRPGLDTPDTTISPVEGVLEDETTDAEGLEKLPYLVIVLDEFADLMMCSPKEVETAVARLAQKARAAGIHLVMATQRPSKEVITGLIKANFTSRMSFRVSSKIDSRIILDQGGADSLLGYGDMLFLRPGSSILSRVHGPFVSEEEVQRVVDHLKAQGQPEYKMEILQAANDVEEEDPADLDPLLEEAQMIVTESRRASISFLQRKLKIGYNRSARIMEQMEKRAIVGPPDSRGERQVLT